VGDESKKKKKKKYFEKVLIDMKEEYCVLCIARDVHNQPSSNQQIVLFDKP
jgi:hypothetical protein